MDGAMQTFVLRVWYDTVFSGHLHTMYKKMYSKV